ncbi:hypothetical protein BVC80_9077g107 [Macleaya cordata]|uniref:Uncharacterized protein n=1 Tax=Macleaya cordata TaxID=56857 RepID=A0A200PLS3_MACCD|nr:hypothetical protein BVC80_9077g107 [Macleaya cordata]
MSSRIEDRISLFRSQLEHRRFEDGTLCILESIFVSKDVNSLLEIRSILKEFMRSEAMFVFQEIMEKSVEEKLFVLEFFVRAFALSGDVEANLPSFFLYFTFLGFQSCLALKYEALILREQKCLNHESLQVSYEEWLTFAEDSLNNGFYSIAVKGFDNALLCIQTNNSSVDPRTDIFANAHIVGKIKKLKDVAVALVASHSVQAQTAEHLKKKTIQKNENINLYSMDTQCLASSMFRNGIKKRNFQKLHALQSLRQTNTEL